MQPTPSRRRFSARRRRRLFRTLFLLLVVAVVLVVVAKRHGSNPSDQHRLTAANPPSAGRTSPSPQTATSKTPTTSPTDSLTAAKIERAYAGRSGTVSVAVDNLRTNKLLLVNPTMRNQTASIIKVDILETLLHHDEETGQKLSEEDAETATGMIEESDNDDATDLWNLDGGSTGVGAYNSEAGLTQTTLNTDDIWGISQTSAADQIKLLRQLAIPGGLLDRADRAYQLHLMHSIEADQDWGVSAGVPKGVSVALKNGWVPTTSNAIWDVNSIGWIKGDGRDYLIAVLTHNDPSEDYGISTIDAVSRTVWHNLSSG